MRATTTILQVSADAVEDAVIDLSRPGMAWIEFRSGVCLCGELDDNDEPVSLAQTLLRLAVLTAAVEGPESVDELLTARASYAASTGEERVPA